jgi:hypothetical protein
MRKIALGLVASAAVVAGTSAFAADELVTTGTSPLLQQARVVCNAAGDCWNTSRRVIIDNGYNYYPRRYYQDRYYDAPYDGPGVGVYGPGFSFGFGTRHYW